MADFTKVLRGLTILDRYRPNQKVWAVSAEHDELFSEGPHPSELSEEHMKQLSEDGWNWNEYQCWRRFT